MQGRSDDVLRFGGQVLHPLVVCSVLVHTPEVVDYHVRQQSTPCPLTRDAATGKLRRFVPLP